MYHPVVESMMRCIQSLVPLTASAFVQRIFLGREHSPHFLDTGWVPVSDLIPGPVLTTEETGVVK
jgi:hypothetical protein